MNPTLESLVRLQQAENELKRVEVELVSLPLARAKVEARLAGERERLDAAKAILDASQKTRKAHEAAVQDLEAKRSKYKGQLMDVKTNKEYTAMLHEIEGVEREIRTREDQILVEMERAESLIADVRHEEALFKGTEETGKAEGRALDQRLAELKVEAGRLAKDRDVVAAQVPEEALDLFKRVAKLRGAAVSPAVDRMCTLCHVKVRPQMWLDLKRSEEILQCPACSRVLYYEAGPVEVSPQP